MINNLYENIATGLNLIKDCTVYREDVPQHFVQPSFLVHFYDQNPTNGINGCLNNTVRVDISYFPEDRLRRTVECWTVGQDLMREFQIEDFKIKNRNMRITDNVLHFMFDVRYREYAEDQNETKMQTMSQNTDLKEE